jgi:uncharacterized membrane protein YecN with MAPEG domain
VYKEEIKKAFPHHKGDPLANGYPDFGMGKLADELSFADWYKLNLAQRAHYNALESFPMALSLVLTSGLFTPIPSAIAGVLYSVGRYMYSTGYVAKGPWGRYPGAYIALCPLIGLLGVNLWFGVKKGLETLPESLKFF